MRTHEDTDINKRKKHQCSTCGRRYTEKYNLKVRISGTLMAVSFSNYFCFGTSASCMQLFRINDKFTDFLLLTFIQKVMLLYGSLPLGSPTMTLTVFSENMVVAAPSDIHFKISVYKRYPSTAFYFL